MVVEDRNLTKYRYWSDTLIAERRDTTLALLMLSVLPIVNTQRWLDQSTPSQPDELRAVLSAAYKLRPAERNVDLKRSCWHRLSDSHFIVHTATPSNAVIHIKHNDYLGVPRPNRICEILADRSFELTSQTASLDVLGNMLDHCASRLARRWTNESELLESGVMPLRSISHQIWVCSVLWRSWPLFVQRLDWHQVRSFSFNPCQSDLWLTIRISRRPMQPRQKVEATTRQEDFHLNVLQIFIQCPILRKWWHDQCSARIYRWSVSSIFNFGSINSTKPWSSQFLNRAGWIDMKLHVTLKIQHIHNKGTIRQGISANVSRSPVEMIDIFKNHTLEHL